MEESHEDPRVASELYFLIAKFLSRGPLQETAKTLVKELQNAKVLPTRLDWEGNEHDQNLDDLKAVYKNIGGGQLVELCRRALCSRQGPRRSLLAPLDRKPTPLNHSIVSRVWARSEGRRVAGWRQPTAAGLLSPRCLSALQLQRRTLGHLSAVYCVLFDRTGRYILTGADDLLVKAWSAVDGRLIATFRGAASEITDVCVSWDNRLLCAGSLDRIIRVWDLQSAAPVAVLQGHSGMITSVHFCPARAGDLRCLVSTSTDGSVAFWTYSQPGQFGKPHFMSKPVQFMERMRPGACHMICCCWSPGGAFLAAGSADHHVRVYMMAEHGAKRILEVAAHSDAVDSMSWAHRGLRFVSGSKDGTACVWTLHATQWRHTTIHMSTTLPGESAAEWDGKKIKVTMVCWDNSDTYIITAVSDYTIKVWNANTSRLVRVLRGHRDETYVLEAHPFFSSVFLSAGHDGQVFVWELEEGRALCSFVNMIEGQGHGAVFDAKWSGDGARLAATDSHGHLLLWGLGAGHDMLRTLPTELFFHTDYRPVGREAGGAAVDEQTGLAPHLLPPPFLVDVEGEPHPPHLQRLVPGRQHCTLHQLIPLTQEEMEPRQIDLMIEALAQRMESEEALGAGGEGGAGGGRGEGGRGVWRGEGVRHTAGVWQRGQLAPAPSQPGRAPLVAPLHPARYLRIDRDTEEMTAMEMAWYRREMRRRPVMISTAEAGGAGGPRRRAGRARRPPAPRPRPPPRPPPPPAHTDDDIEVSEEESDTEVEAGLEGGARAARGAARRRGGSSDSSVRLSGARPYSDTSADTDTGTGTRKSSSSSSSSEYSDWVADKPNIALAPPKRSKRKPVARKRYSPTGTVRKAKGRINGVRRASSPALPSPPSPAEILPDLPARRPADEAAAPAGDAGDAADEEGGEVELPEAYRPSEWLCAVVPKKAPYHPQMGDECLYFKLGHQRYFEAVSEKDVYKVNARDKPWERTSIDDCELVKVVGIKYLIRPPRIVCLKLASLTSSSPSPAKSFTVKYHDMADVIDFLVLRQHYDNAMARNWAPGDRFRSMIDDNWWTGAVVENLGGGAAGAGTSRSGAPGAWGAQASHFLSLRVRWDNGEYERMSPWDLEPIDPNYLPAEVGGCVPVLKSELENILYRPRGDEWPPHGDRRAACARIPEALDQVMSLSIAEPFVAPVDLNAYPSYAYVVEYPIDLSTIKSRFESFWYRRVTAAQFDVRYLATNAEKFNGPKSPIARSARIVTDLLLRIISELGELDVVCAYHELVNSYQSSDSEAEAEADTHMVNGSGKRRRRVRGAGRDVDSDGAGAGPGAGAWRELCAGVLRELCASADAEPFRQPVDGDTLPDYSSVVVEPMDLGSVRARLERGAYTAHEQFARDVRLVFANSRLYNTNKRSRIYSMTMRLSSKFEDLYSKLLTALKSSRRRRRRPIAVACVEVRRRAGPYSGSSRSPSAHVGPGRRAGRGGEEYGSSDEETLAATSRRKRAGRRPRPRPRAPRAPAAGDDSWDSDVPLTTHGKGKGVGKKSKSAASEGSCEPSTSAGVDRARDRLASAASDEDDDVDDNNDNDTSDDNSHYENIEVLEEELPEDEVELTYERRWSPDTSTTTRSMVTRARKRKRKRVRKRRDSSDQSDAGHRATRARHKKVRGVAPDSRVSFPTSVSSSSSSTSGDGDDAGAASARRYESDHSYRPRHSSEDDQPLHTLSRRLAVDPSGAGPSRPRRTATTQRGRLRRCVPPQRYNEDSDEDSIAAISKRLRADTSPRLLNARGRAARGPAPSALDHTYYNGHAHIATRHRTTDHNDNTSEGGEDEPVSVSSRGRVRRLTAKARGFFRD